MRLNNILCSDTRVKCCAIFNKQANSSKTHDLDVVDGRLLFFCSSRLATMLASIHVLDNTTKKKTSMYKQTHCADIRSLAD